MIELLVIVAIITILASLLFPSLSRGAQLARDSTCKSNLRQSGLAMAYYLADNGFYPLNTLNQSPDFGGEWRSELSPYLDGRWKDYSGGTPVQATTPAVTACPDYVRLGGVFHLNFWSYGYNSAGARGSFVGAIKQDWRGLGGRDLRIERPRDLPTLESDVVCPSDMLEIGDAVFSYHPTVSNWVVGNPEISFYALTEVMAIWAELGMGPKFPGYERSIKLVQSRHGGRWNIVFCDGHVESFKTKALFARDPGMIKRWNVDDLPHLDDLSTLLNYR